MEEQLLSLRTPHGSAVGMATGGGAPGIISAGTNAEQAPAAASNGVSAGVTMREGERAEQDAQRVREGLGLRNHVFRSLHPVSITKLSKADEPRSPAGMLPPDPLHE